ncbi:hypothetical protein [Hymenobacter chitinivorans]|uniref:Uncharacterized protein n=1 Tax=Hymenobacter chitinivorans DSM 11115 TaxID=1121954 RepID=A0A2M9BAC8_9BACT|nr:hypothetical protein [Hymenobacter chitinivorans]PJJ54894.1 hypothetical protein CLV45_3240 [Hymenobacter chitinivorans DSM 11115]
MNSYFILWPNEWCKRLAQANDAGPLQVVYGGPHISVPSLGKVMPGDLIYSVAIKDGQLFILGKLEVEQIQDADSYLKQQRVSKPDGELWDTLALPLLKQQPHLGHLIPRSCIEKAATGLGSNLRFDFSVPTAVAHMLRFGPKPGQEKELPQGKEGRVSHIGLQGHFRRLSIDSAALVATLMSEF